MDSAQVSLKGRIKPEDVARIESTVNSMSSDGAFSVESSTEHIEPSFLDLSAQVIGVIAAFLVIVDSAKSWFNKQSSYEDVIRRVNDFMAERGVASIEIVDVANFYAVKSSDKKGPVILTVKDLKTGLFYKVFYYHEKKVYTLEITHV